MENNNELLEEVTNALCVFLRLDRPNLISNTIEERVKEVVVAKLCELMHIVCPYNYNNDTFYFYSLLVGDVLINKMGYKIQVAPAVFKLFKYNGINYIEEVDRLITTLPLDKSLIDCFVVLDELKEKFEEFKVNKYAC